MSTWNQFFERVRASLVLSRDEVVTICRLGGLEISNCTASGWSQADRDSRRFVKMSKDDFDSFTAGLVTWARHHIN